MIRPRRSTDLLWLLGPTLLVLLVFFYTPLLLAGWTSLHEDDLLTPPRFVGAANYVELAQSGELAAIVLRSLVASAAIVVLSTSAGLALAVSLARPGWLVAFVRSAVFSAYVVSWVSVGLVWLWLLDADQGLLATLLKQVGGPRIPWLTDPRWALTAVILVSAWKLTGYAMVSYLAALQDVPRSLLEAAALDGAGPAQRFFRITLPLLAPTTRFVVVTSAIAGFQLFDVVRVLTQGGPVRSTSVIAYAIYEDVFQLLRVGRASALVVVAFLVLLALTGLMFWPARRAA